MKLRIYAAALACVAAVSSSPAQNDGDVAFAFQGRVKVQGQPFNGTGQFKFAVVDTSGTTTLWSNDGTGANAQEPTGHVSLPVQDGVFNVLIGDSAAGMHPVNPTIFNSQTPRKLRVWFNDGSRGFQQLLPDQSLVNLSLIALTSGNKDFTIYVRQSDGNDADNGLTAATAKKTIQAAIDVLPDRVRNNVTIDIEPGTYREEVIVSGITVPQLKLVTIIGDKTWTPAAAGSPSVVITGKNAAGTRVRESGLRCLSSTRFLFKGLTMSGTSGFGVGTDYSSCEFQNCKVTDALNNGFLIGANCYVRMSNCVAEGNTGSGIRVGAHSDVHLTACKATGNTFTGLLVDGFSQAFVMATCEFRDNSDSQIWLANAVLNCLAPVKVMNTNPTVAKRGISNHWKSMIAGYSNIQYSGLLSPTLEEGRGGSHWD